MLGTTIRVQVAGTVREYPTMVAEYGTHLAGGGVPLSLDEARAQARGFWKLNKNIDRAFNAVTFWVTLDGSGLAYRLDFFRHGSWNIAGAAPMSGCDNVHELYVA
jgi:hypothetical protein